MSIECLTDLGTFSAVDKIFLREPNSLTQVSLTNRIPGEKAFLNLTAARAATFKHGRIKRGVDRLLLQDIQSLHIKKVIYNAYIM